MFCYIKTNSVVKKLFITKNFAILFAVIIGQKCIYNFFYNITQTASFVIYCNNLQFEQKKGIL